MTPDEHYIQIYLKPVAKKPSPGAKLDTSIGAAAFITEEIGHQAQEHLLLVMLNVRLRVSGLFLVGVGDKASTPYSIPHIMQALLLNNAHTFIMAHNHPSGDTTPSPEDIRMTRKVLQVARLMNLEFADHIIVGPNENSYTSLKELGHFIMATDPAQVEKIIQEFTDAN